MKFLQTFNHQKINLMPFASPRFNLFMAISFSGFLVILTGCQQGLKTDYHKLSLAQVSGTITLDGVPLRNANLIFQSPSNADFSTGKTDLQGRYTMMFNSEKEGVLVGEQIVRIRKRRFAEADYIKFRDQLAGLDVSDDAEAKDEKDTDVAGDLDSAQGDSFLEPSRNDGELPAEYHIDGKIRVTVQEGSQTISFDLKSDGSTTGQTS